MFLKYIKKQSIDYKRKGIGEWYLVLHTDLEDEPYYFDTYKHSDGRVSNLYPNGGADDPDLEKLIENNKKIINSENTKAKFVRIFSRFIFLPHWFLILLSGFNTESMTDGFFLISFLGYAIAFISFFGLFNALIGLNFKFSKEIIIFLAISFVGFLIISLGKYRSIDLYGAKINLYFVALLMGNLKGFLYSIQEELTTIY
tara:strand:- start:592 stop:1191 length:600 start_codon:yes stop_codon:yes gene_type:complete